jgi:sugar lactone lactonase YvrE
VLSIHWSVRSILPSTISSCISNRRSKLGQMTMLCGVLVALTCCIGAVAAAQTAHFTGVQSIVGSSAQYEPDGVAVDASGNVYISDESNNAVYKETLAANGLYVQSTVASGLNAASALAVDGSGNVFIIEYTGSGSVLKETPSSSGYTQSTVASNLNWPSGVAVDGSGNVYIADTVNGRVLLETPSSGGYTQSVVVSGSIYPRGIAVDGNKNVYFVDGISSAVLKETPSNGSFIQSKLFAVPTTPAGLAIDSSGNLYVTDPISPNGRVFKETRSGGRYTESTIGNDLDLPSAVAVDGSGNIYIADTFNYRVLKETPSGGNFGTVNVGSPSTKMSWIFTFDTAGTIGTPVVLTQGATGLDFADAGTGSCTTNGTTSQYNIGDTCTVGIVFTPTTAGTRNGSVELVSNSGSVIASGTAQGVGQASGVSLDFAITSPGNVTPSVTASAGGQAVYPFVISPLGGTGMPGAVSLSVTGLPTAATAVFSPSTLSVGATTTNAILLVTLPTQSAAQPLRNPFGRGALPVALGLLLLPFAGNWRKAARRMNRMNWMIVLGLSSLAMIAGLTGCSSGGSGSSAQTYTLTITATSGSLSHSTTATLIVE